MLLLRVRPFLIPPASLGSVFHQDRLIKNPASGMCLTARGKHPGMVPCNLADPHQLWSFT